MSGPTRPVWTSPQEAPHPLSLVWTEPADAQPDGKVDSDEWLRQGLRGQRPVKRCPGVHAPSAMCLPGVDEAWWVDADLTLVGHSLASNEEQSGLRVESHKTPGTAHKEAEASVRGWRRWRYRCHDAEMAVAAVAAAGPGEPSRVRG